MSIPHTKILLEFIKSDIIHFINRFCKNILNPIYMWFGYLDFRQLLYFLCIHLDAPTVTVEFEVSRCCCYGLEY